MPVDYSLTALIAELMIEHNIGVSTSRTFALKRIDADYPFGGCFPQTSPANPAADPLDRSAPCR